MNLNFSKINVLVIGDIMLDKYIYGSSNRISPEAPVPIFLLDHDKGIYQLRPYSSKQLRAERLRRRSFNLALTTQMCSLSQDKKFCAEGLEKQLLRILFSLDQNIHSIKLKRDQ